MLACPVEELACDLDVLSLLTLSMQLAKEYKLSNCG